MNSLANNPLVSVCLITYNHEKFIRKAIESVLSQEVSFELEIIIADDYSIDSTREIILEYYKENKSLIKLLFQETNVGAANNFIDLINHAKGKYIAYLEGDDFWIDNQKIKKQVEFMEKNPEYNIVFTDFNILYESTNKLVKVNHCEKFFDRTTFSIKDITYENIIPSLTAMYRNIDLKFPNNFKLLWPGDWPFNILHAKTGKIKFLNFKSSVYRIHESGTCSSNNPSYNFKRHIETAKLMTNWFGYTSKIKFYLIYSIIKFRLQLFKIWVKSKIIKR
jgi:glycosyltransferase involved in cell wall biosynthesis